LEAAQKKFEEMEARHERELKEFDEAHGRGGAASAGHAKEAGGRKLNHINVKQARDMSKKELEEACSERGLSKKGSREDVMMRLIVWIQEHEDEEQEEEKEEPKPVPMTSETKEDSKSDDSDDGESGGGGWLLKKDAANAAPVCKKERHPGGRRGGRGGRGGRRGGANQRNSEKKEEEEKSSSEDEGEEEKSPEAAADVDGGRVLSTRVSMLQELVPSTFALPPQMDAVCSMHIINDVLWIGGMTGAVISYSLPRFQQLSCTRLHKTRINSIIRVGSTRLFCSSEEGEIYVFPPKDPSRAKHHTAHDFEHNAIKSLLFLDGDRPRVWSCAPGRNNTQITVMNKKCEVKYKLTLMASLCCATISPTMETCWFGCSNSTILVCDAIHGDLRREISLPDDSSKQSVRAMLSVGDLVWCASGDKVYIYDPFTFTVEKTVTTSPPMGIESLALFENVVLAGTTAGTVECFDSISMAHIMTLKLSASSPASLP